MITGGCGFIGSHLVRLFVKKYPNYHIINVDALTYAGNMENLKDIEEFDNYTFVKADICDYERIIEVMRQYSVDGVIHLAAESHVDRLCPWNSPGKNTEVKKKKRILKWTAIPFFRGIFPRTEPRSPSLQADSLLSEAPGKPTEVTNSLDKDDSLFKSREPKQFIH